MIKQFFQMLVLSFKLGKFLPVKIFMPLRYKIASNAKIELGSRLVVGSDSSQLPVSANKVNISFGSNAVVTFGKGVSLGPGVSLIVKNNAKLLIGDETYITADSHIEAVNEIKIGKNCAISWGVTLIDDNHHKIIYSGVMKENGTNVIEISDHVWIGCHVVILPGTRIGENSVVAAGSVVKGEFPSNVLIAGNPAKIIKQTVDWN